jgi:hypothetical protein
MAEFVLLVVNMMGWMKGPVRDLDRRIEGIFGPGFVFEVNKRYHYSHAQGHPPRGPDVKMDDLNHTK